MAVGRPIAVGRTGGRGTRGYMAMAMRRRARKGGRGVGLWRSLGSVEGVGG